MRKATRIVAGLAVAPLLVGGLAACNKDAAPGTATKPAADAGKDARTRFLEASDRTSDVKKSRMTMKFDASPESVVKIASAMASTSATSSASATPLDPKIARLIAGSQIVVDSQATGDKTLKDETDPAKGAVRMAWRTDSDLVDFVMAKQDLFVKLDLAKIGDQTGAFSMSDVQAQAASLPAWLQDAINGKWVGMSKDTMNQLTKSAGADLDSASLTPQQAQQLNDAARKRLTDNGTFTGDGDDIAVTVTLKPFLTGVLADAKRIAPKQFTEQTTKDLDKSLESLKADATLALDTTLADGRLKTMKMDLGQVLDMVDETTIKDAEDKKQLQDLKAKDITFPVVMDYSEPDGDVTAPGGARMITQADLEQLTGGAPSGAPSSAPARS